MSSDPTSVPAEPPASGDDATAPIDPDSTTDQASSTAPKFDPSIPRARLEQAVGSTAGSGSGAFHVYREHRRTEMDRIEAMERENEIAKRKEDFAKRLELSHQADRAKLEKNQRRRKQRKIKAEVGKKQQRTASEEEQDANNSADDVAAS